MPPAHKGEPELCRLLVSGVLHYGRSQDRKEGRQTGKLCKEMSSVQLKGHYKIQAFLLFIVIPLLKI